MYQIMRVHDGDRYVVALVRRANKYMHLIFIEYEGVKHKAVPVEEERFMKPVFYKDKPYPVARAAKQYRVVARAKGITEAAKSELAAAMAELKEEAG